VVLKYRHKRMCATEHAPHGRFDLLHHGYGLADIISGAVVLVKNRPAPRRATMATPEDEVMTSPGGIYGKTVGDLSVLTAPRSSPEAASPTAVSATRPDTPAPPGTRRPRRDGCVHRLVFDDVNANDGAWRDEDVLASGLSRVAVEPAPKRRRREPAVRFTAPLSERHAVQGQYDEQNRRP
jgi:hypothetical protein